MTSLSHLAAFCCIPISNPQGRMKEQRILRDAAADAVRRAALVSQGAVRSRCHGHPARRALSEITR